jgi:hypothetical protein
LVCLSEQPTPINFVDRASDPLALARGAKSAIRHMRALCPLSKLAVSVCTGRFHAALMRREELETAFVMKDIAEQIIYYELLLNSYYVE